MAISSPTSAYKQKARQSFKSGLPVVYLQHGYIDSSDTFIVTDETNSIGFQLANQGYDVWFGNSRGNKYSKRHVSLTPQQDEFWQFSWQNMSHFDLPAAFQYIYGQTKQLINYIGHSQGTTIMFAALSDREPVVLKYIKSFIALNPVAWVGNSSGLFSLTAATNLTAVLELLDVQEVFNSNFATSTFGFVFCNALPYVCEDVIKFAAGGDARYDNEKRYGFILAHYPAGTSLMTQKHWDQNTQTGRFKKFDYGTSGNLQHYNQAKVPDYDVSKITMPVNLFVTSQDKIGDPADFQILRSHLTGSSKVNVYNYPGGHATLTWTKNINLYFNDVLKVLRRS